MTKTISLLAACSLDLILALTPVHAQEGEPELQPLPAEVSASFDKTLADLAVLRQDIKELERRAQGTEGLLGKVLAKRRDVLWIEMFQGTIEIARLVSLQMENNKDVSAYYEQLQGDLRVLPDEVYGTLENIRQRVAFPSAEMPPEEFVVADQKLFSHMREADNFLRELVAFTQIG